MKDAKRTLIDALMTRTFNRPRTPRSAEYRQGVRAIFELRVLGKPSHCVYTHGSAQADAYFAGTHEGHDRWREYQDELKAAATKSETRT